MSKPYYEDGSVTIYHGDCREIVPGLSGVDLLLADPPYGMAWNGKVTRGRNGTGKKGPTRSFGSSIVGDDVAFDPRPWVTFPKVILWGFQHYAAHLPVGSVLVWLKRYDDGFGSFLSDADLAWMKGGHGVYCMRDVSLQGDSRNRRHPTEKPLPLMQWCIIKAGDVDTVLDPFMGSGTTLRAAKDLGRKAIGIEIEERYCEIAANRMRQEVLAL